MPCHAMHPIQELFLESLSYVLQIDMHFICTPMWTKFYSCEKWVLQLPTPPPSLGRHGDSPPSNHPQSTPRGLGLLTDSTPTVHQPPVGQIWRGITDDKGEKFSLLSMLWAKRLVGPSTPVGTAHCNSAIYSFPYQFIQFKFQI
jgi:hypothetical protein